MKRKCGKAYRKSFGSLIGRGLTVTEHMHVTGQTAKKVKEMRKTAVINEATFKLSAQYAEGTIRTGHTHKVEIECTREFMKKELGNRSGQDKEGYYQYHSRDYLYWNIYYNEFQKVCAMIADRVADMDDMTQASFRGQPGQPKTRTQRNFTNFGVHGKLSKSADPRNSRRVDTEILDEQDLEWTPKDRLIPLTYNEFWSAIERKGGEGLRIKRVKQVSTMCPHCTNLAALEEAYDRLAGELIPDKVQMAKVFYKRTQARLHRKFYTHQRPFTQWFKSWMVEHPDEKVCLVFQDYGKFYNSSGQKVKDLCFVICYTDDKGELCYKYIDNLFQGASDSKSTEGIWTKILEETDTFDEFDTIYVSGDTGNGFRGYSVASFFSTWRRRFNKRVVQCFLCPRHAYSLCDAHFGHLYEIIHTQKILGWLESADDYKEAIESSINEGRIANTTVFAWSDFPKIKVTKISGGLISHATHIEYPDGDGWALARQVSGSGLWRLIRLSKEYTWKKKFCKKCSQADQRPVVAHGPDDCPRSKRGVAVPQGPPRHLKDALDWKPDQYDESAEKLVEQMQKSMDQYKVNSLEDLDKDTFFVVLNGQKAPNPTWSVVKMVEKKEDGQVKIRWYGSSKRAKKDKHRLKKQVTNNFYLSFNCRFVCMLSIVYTRSKFVFIKYLHFES